MRFFNRKKEWLEWDEYAQKVHERNVIDFLHSTAVSSYNNLRKRGWKE